MAAQPEPLSPSRAPWAKRVTLAALMAIIGVNLWTGGALVALWIGSRLQERAGSSLTIRPTTALAVFGSLAAITWALARLLRWVSGAYDRATGAGPAKRQRASWLGSDERHIYPGDRPSFTALERIMIVTVIVAALTFEVWFFFFSTSPIDQRTGRSSLPIASTSQPLEAAELRVESCPQLRTESRPCRASRRA
jgi:hypothetical protein